MTHVSQAISKLRLSSLLLGITLVPIRTAEGRRRRRSPRSSCRVRAASDCGRCKRAENHKRCQPARRLNRGRLVGGKRKLLAHLLRRLFGEDSPIFRPPGFSCGNILRIAARVGVGQLRFGWCRGRASRAICSTSAGSLNNSTIVRMLSRSVPGGSQSAHKRMISKRCMLRWHWLKACAAKGRGICADILGE
jgi:hypothetical protein